jgi:hypothetical protein
MDPQRQSQLFRAFVMSKIREKGLRFDRVTVREAGNEIKRLNESMPNLKITASELLTVYLEIMRELVAEHFALIEKEIEAAKRNETGAKPRRTTTTGGIPGPVFKE